MKLKVVVFLLVFSSLSSFSQVEKKVRFGVKAGVNLSNVLTKHNDIKVSGNYKLGYQIGLFTKVSLSDVVKFSPALLFSHQGYQGEGGLYDGVDNNVYTANYVENYIILPVVVDFYPTERFALYLGPQIDLLFFRKTNFISDEVDDFDGNYLSDFYWGAKAGIGYDISPVINIEIGYNYGFKRKLVVYDKSEFIKRNAVWMLNFNYTFN